MSAGEPRDTTRPLPLGLGAARVFALTFEGLVWTRRGLFVAALMVLPVLLAAAFRWLRPETMPATWGALDVYRWIVVNYYVSNALPLAALFYAGALVTDELEGRTIVYLLTRPVSRTSILAGRFAAYFAAGLALTVPVLLATFLILGGAAPGLSSVVTLARDLGVAALTLFVYGALFMLLGIVFRRPLIAGLFFLYGWELLVYVGGHVPRVTLTAYLRSLSSAAPSTAEGAARLLAFTPLPVGESLLSLLLASAVFIALAFVLFASRELLPEG
jgi:ABC-type transport system involved in multi-copper enzyme maturation permease subunit